MVPAAKFPFNFFLAYLGVRLLPLPPPALLLLPDLPEALLLPLQLSLAVVHPGREGLELIGNADNRLESPVIKNLA